jgi:molybdopterin-containing oxidoreductase family iron-sulfur binding subunit
MKYGMVIDLRRCIGCNACTVACKQQYGNPPGIFYSHVGITEVGKYPNARQVPLPVLCNHCDNPPCVDVCPTGASQKLDNGIVTIDANKCIGCRDCMVACPFNVRQFIGSEPKGYYPDKGGLTTYEKVAYAQHQVGTVEKCSFCAARLAQGQLPACVLTCVGQARFFGDLEDPNSQVSKLIVQFDAKPLNPEAGTKPNVFYIGL